MFLLKYDLYEDTAWIGNFISTITHQIGLKIIALYNKTYILYLFIFEKSFIMFIMYSTYSVFQWVLTTYTYYGTTLQLI